jgi:hypothetical protein
MKTLELILCALTFTIFIGAILCGMFRPCGWSQCPECSWWHHKDGRLTYDEPETWDGVRTEKICHRCAGPIQSDNFQSVEPIKAAMDGKTFENLGHATNEDHLPERLVKSVEAQAQFVSEAKR